MKKLKFPKDVAHASGVYNYKRNLILSTLIMSVLLFFLIKLILKWSGYPVSSRAIFSSSLGIVAVTLLVMMCAFASALHFYFEGRSPVHQRLYLRNFKRRLKRSLEHLSRKEQFVSAKRHDTAALLELLNEASPPQATEKTSSASIATVI